MEHLLFLSCPYSDPSEAVRRARYDEAVKAAADLMRRGHFVLCPVIMNHPVEAELLAQELSCPSGYWKLLEALLANVSSELVLLQLPGWQESRGVAREIALFSSLYKPISLYSPDAELTVVDLDSLS